MIYKHAKFNSLSVCACILTRMRIVDKARGIRWHIFTQCIEVSPCISLYSYHWQVSWLVVLFLLELAWANCEIGSCWRALCHLSLIGLFQFSHRSDDWWLGVHAYSINLNQLYPISWINAGLVTKSLELYLFRSLVDLSQELLPAGGPSEPCNKSVSQVLSSLLEKDIIRDSRGGHDRPHIRWLIALTTSFLKLFCAPRQHIPRKWPYLRCAIWVLFMHSPSCCLSTIVKPSPWSSNV